MISMKKVINIVMLFLVISIALNIGLYKKLDSTYSQYETCKKSISPTYDYLNSITIRFLYKGIIINHNKKLSQPTLKRRFFKKKAAFFSWPGLGKEWC